MYLFGSILHILYCSDRFKIMMGIHSHSVLFGSTLSECHS